MPFISVTHNYKAHCYKLGQFPTQGNRERWKVTGGNGELILSNNRPILEQKRLKHWQPEWKAEGQGLWNKSFMEALCEAIEGHIRRLAKK